MGAVAFTPQGLPPGPRLVWSTPPNTMLCAPLSCPLGFARHQALWFAENIYIALILPTLVKSILPIFSNAENRAQRESVTCPKSHSYLIWLTMMLSPLSNLLWKGEEGGSLKTDYKTSKWSLLSRS